MTYENSIVFGRNAAMINEAYSKMYSKKKGKRSRMITEASDEPTERELLGGDTWLSDADRRNIQNFDAEREYRDAIATEKRGRDLGDDETEEETTPAATATTDSVEDGEDEDTRNFMSSFDMGGNRSGGKRRQDDDDLIFANSRYEDEWKSMHYPDWLRAAAEKAGHTLHMKMDRASMVEPLRYKGHGARIVNVADEEARKEDEQERKGEPWQFFWENVIEKNPDIFNDENYDMDELAKHKFQIYEKSMEFIKVGVDEVDAAQRVLEEIPGCEMKDTANEEDFVGDIDIEDETEDEEPIANMSSSGGRYGIVVKKYEVDYSSGDDINFDDRDNRKKIETRYITPQEFKEHKFDTEDEAIDALRNYMALLVGNPEDVSIGVVVDGDITNRIMRGEEGLNASIYTISSSDKEHTDLIFKYLFNRWKGRNLPECDEYLK